MPNSTYFQIKITSILLPALCLRQVGQLYGALLWLSVKTNEWMLQCKRTQGMSDRCVIRLMHQTYLEHRERTQCTVTRYTTVHMFNVLSLSKGIRIQTLSTTQRCPVIHFLQTDQFRVQRWLTVEALEIVRFYASCLPLCWWTHCDRGNILNTSEQWRSLPQDSQMPQLRKSA